MVLDYSKWDALELSDDSDIEVHPNVDKRSFIRAKQAQIHQQREQRRHDIKTYKYERIINDGLLSRIDKLLDVLRQHEDSSAAPEQLIFQTIMEFASDPDEDQAPPPPEGVHTHEKEQPKYSQMMSALVDQVKKEFGDSKPDNMFKAYITGVQGHKDKVQGLQKELLTKLAQLEKEESSKITSEGLHDGFNSSFVRKAEPKPMAAAPAKKAEVELLNPGAGSSSATQAEEDDDDDDPANIEISPLAKQFAKLKPNDYTAYQRFIVEHPEIVATKETDGLLVEAFNSQLKGEDAYARQCVHQGLLLQYCRSLGPDGIKLFFGRYVDHPNFYCKAPLTYFLAESQPRDIVLRIFSPMMSTTPTTVLRPARLSSKKRTPTTLLALSRSNCMQSTPTPRSPSTSLQPTVRILPRSRLARSSSLSPQSFRKPWHPSLWTRSIRSSARCPLRRQRLLLSN